MSVWRPSTRGCIYQKYTSNTCEYLSLKFPFAPFEFYLHTLSFTFVNPFKHSALVVNLSVTLKHKIGCPAISWTAYYYVRSLREITLCSMLRELLQGVR